MRVNRVPPPLDPIIGRLVDQRLFLDFLFGFRLGGRVGNVFEFRFRLPARRHGSLFFGDLLSRLVPFGFGLAFWLGFGIRCRCACSFWRRLGGGLKGFFALLDFLFLGRRFALGRLRRFRRLPADTRGIHALLLDGFLLRRLLGGLLEKAFGHALRVFFGLFFLHGAVSYVMLNSARTSR